MLSGGRRNVAAAILLLWTIGCDRGAVADPPHPLASERAATAPTSEPSTSSELRDGIVLGEFRLKARPVVDGDTIRVEGFDKSIRLLGIDTEEKAKSPRERKRMERDFPGHLRRARGASRRPVRAATPMGDEATAFAEAFFEAGALVRLERDDPRTLRGRYGRPLAYVFVRRNGRWTSYNVEAVRAGMSPYFTKYGYSRRFHQQFARAEEEAREAQRGIWDPTKQHYDDYAERKAWWNARADFIRAFEHASTGRDDHVVLWRSDADERLEERLDEDTVVLGNVDAVQRFRGLARVFLASAGTKDFPIIFRDYDVFNQTGIGDRKREPVAVRGSIERYTKGDVDTLQIVVTDPSQVAFADEPQSPRATKPSPGR